MKITKQILCNIKYEYSLLNKYDKIKYTETDYIVRELNKLIKRERKKENG